MFKDLLKATVESLLQVCEAARARWQVRQTPDIDAHTKPNQVEIFLLNCLLDIWRPLSQQSSCAAHAAELKQNIDSQVHPSPPFSHRLLSE
jgi:hypothetical protein